MAAVKIIDLDEESGKKDTPGHQSSSESRNHLSNGEQSAAGENDNEGNSLSEKEKGNKCFAEGRYVKAVEHWLSGLRTLDYILSKEIEEKKKLEEFRTMKKTLHLNLALGCLRVERGMDCVKHCDKALELDSTNTKALYRKAQGWIRLSEHEHAVASLNALIEVDPRNTAALQLLRETKLNMRRHVAKEKKMNKALFEQLEHDQRSIEETVGWGHRVLNRWRHVRNVWSQSVGVVTAMMYLLCHTCKRRSGTFVGAFGSKAD